MLDPLYNSIAPAPQQGFVIQHSGTTREETTSKGTNRIPATASAWALLQGERAAARVVVHEQVHIEAALAGAAATGQAVVLISGPAMGGAMGGPWFRHLISDVAGFYPQVRFAAVIDCGSAIGFALAVLADGATAIRLQASRDTLKRVRDIAKQSGAVVDESTQPVLDLLFHPDPVTACRAWLQIGAIALR